jgi:hypothetical protein
MAFSLTYDTLVAELQQYPLRNDERYIENIPVFIMLGQRQVCNDLKILQIKTYVTDTLTKTSNTLAKPADWLNTSYFSIGTGQGFTKKLQLKSRSQSYCDYYWPDATQTGTPKYFCDNVFNKWQFYPTPDQNYPCLIGYFAQPQLLSPETQTNPLTLTIPHVLLKACLIQTAPFLKDDDRVPMWKQEYIDAKAAVTTEDLARIYDGYSKRNL